MWKSLTVEETPLGSAFMVGGNRLFALVDADAELEGVSRGVLAEAYRQRVAEAVRNYRRDREPDLLWRNAGRAALVTLGLGLVLWLASRVLRRLRGALDRRYRARLAVKVSRSARSGTTIAFAHTSYMFPTMSICAKSRSRPIATPARHR